MPASAAPRRRPVRREPNYRALADFRYELRRFLAFSKEAVEALGVAPQQYQALLAVKACEGQGLSVTDLSRQLFIRLHTAVELSVRLEEAGLIARVRSLEDRRRVLLHVTKKGDGLLAQLAEVHHEQLEGQAKELIAILQQMSQDAEDAAAQA